MISPDNYKDVSWIDLQFPFYLRFRNVTNINLIKRTKIPLTNQISKALCRYTIYGRDDLSVPNNIS